MELRLFVPTFQKKIHHKEHKDYTKSTKRIFYKKILSVKSINLPFNFL